MQHSLPTWVPARPRAWTRFHGTAVTLAVLSITAASVCVAPAAFTLSSAQRPAAAPTGSSPTATTAATTVPGSMSTTTAAHATTVLARSTRAHGKHIVSAVTAATWIDPDAGVPGVAPPPTIAADCSVDVSAALTAWLSTLAPNTLVRPPVGACYLVDHGITLKFPVGLTIDGGRFENHTTVATFTGSGLGRATFFVLGGSHVTLEDLSVVGANPGGGYHRELAFEAGINLQGTAGGVIRNVNIDHVYGDGITLDPLRGASDHRSGTILAPVSGLTVNNVTIDGTGRQGIALVSVDGATMTDVALSNVGMDTFDVEADQADEGAANVTINGCTSSSWNGGSFFANGGAGNGPMTHDIIVENCTMAHPQGGDVLLVDNNGTSHVQRGPITLTNDTLWCGVSVYVGCFQTDGADVSVTNSVIRFPRWRQLAHVYGAAGTNIASTLSFVNDTVLGYTALGAAQPGSSLVINGGSWQSDLQVDTSGDLGLPPVPTG